MWNKLPHHPLPFPEGVENAEKIVQSCDLELLAERLRGGPYSGVRDLYERLALPRDTLEALARAGAFDDLQERPAALYQIGALVHVQPPAQKPLLSARPAAPPLPELSVREQVTWDYRIKGLNEWGVHPVDLMRQQLLALGAVPMVRLPHHDTVTTAGVVIAKQRPPTAKGFAFYVLEDGPAAPSGRSLPGPVAKRT